MEAQDADAEVTKSQNHWEDEVTELRQQAARVGVGEEAAGGPPPLQCLPGYLLHTLPMT